MSVRSRSQFGAIPCYASLEPRNLLATIVVNTAADVIDPNDGLISLREAVIETNSNGEDDVIVLEQSTYLLSLEGVSEDGSLTGDLDITPDALQTLTIRGVSNADTTIDGGKIDRVFEIFEDANVTFEDLHITGGSDSQQSTETGRRGGGIKSSTANLFLDRVRMTDNDTGFFGVGGAIWAAGGQVEITNSVFTDNTSDSAGAAIFLRETQGAILNSVVSFNRFNQTTLSVSSSTIESRDTTLVIQRTTLEENSRGINATNGTLDVSESRFLRHGDPAPGFSGAFAKRAYGIKSDGTEVTVDSTNFVANENAIDFDGTESDLSINDALFHGNFRSTLFAGDNITIADSQYRRQTGGLGAVQFVTVQGSDSPDINARTATVTGSVFEFNDTFGIRGNMATLRISDSRFESNEDSGVDVGGNLFVRDSSFLNHAAWAHGIETAGERTEIINSVVQGNGNTGINITQTGQVLISHTIMSENIGRGSGGGLRLGPFHQDSRIVVSNSVITDNRVRPAFNPDGSQFAEGGAIGIRNPTSSSNFQLIVASSTIAKNWAQTQGGIISTNFEVDHSVEFHNSIFWGNRSPSFRLATPGLSVTAFHSIIHDGAGADGNVPFGGTANGNDDRFPQFVDWPGSDYRLTVDSPAVDAGDNALLQRDPADVDGDDNTIEYAPDFQFRSRLLGGTTDIGAFEFRS